MRILPPFEEKIRRQIRDEIAKKPTLSVSGIKEQLEKTFGRGFDYIYIRKLVGKVRNELTVNVDRAQIEPRLAELKENYRLMRDELLKLVYWTPATAVEGMPKPLARDRIEAAKNVVMLDLAVLQAELANGMYKKPAELIAREIRYEPLPPEMRAVIVAAWARGGLLPAAVVDRIVPAAVPPESVATAAPPHLSSDHGGNAS
jgi:hypothetical protein